MSENYQELPSGWVSAPLGSFTDILGGSTPSRKETRYFEGDIVWLTPTEIPKETVSVISNSKEMLTEEGFKESGVRWIPAGSVLLTSRASIGYVAIAGVKLTTNQGFASFVLPEEIDPKYLGWWLRSQKTALEDLAKGTTFKEISKATLRDVLAPIAPLNEQHHIVAAIEQQFSRLDAAVTFLQHAKTKLKRQRAAILKAAVEGTLTEKWRKEHPVTETASQLLERILQERRAKWEAEQLAKMQARGVTPKDDTWKKGYKEPEPPDTENLPELPEGWIWATLDELSCHVTSGSRGWAQYYANSGSLFIRVGNFNRLSTKIDLQNVVFVRAPDSLEADRCRLQIGDLLITITADVGMIGVADERVFQWGQAFINQHVGLIRLIDSKLTTVVALALVSEAMQTQIKNKQYGATKIGLGLEDIRSLTVPFAPLAEQEQIVSEVEARLSIIAQTEAEVEANLKRAERLRQTILSEAFAGRLVPQDPDDEPASVLLERIQEARKGREERKKGKGGNGQNGHYVKVSDEPVRIDVEGVEQVGLWEGVGG